jgi:hypothetical protein
MARIATIGTMICAADAINGDDDDEIRRSS